MTRLTLIDNYVYTEHPIEYDYTIVYSPQTIHYTDTLDIDIHDSLALCHYVIEHYNTMTKQHSNNYVLLVEEVVDEGTLEGAIQHIKEAARVACLTAIQESTLVDKVAQWVAERQPQLMEYLPQGQVKRSVIPYPYAAHDAGMLLYVDNTRRHTFTSTQVCGIPTLLVVPYAERQQHKRTGTQHTYAAKHTLSAEEAVRAIQQLQAAYNYGATTQQMTDILHRVNKLVYTDSAWGNGTVEVVKDQGLQQHKDIHLQVEGEDTATHIHTQPHSDTHIQQEDTTHVYSVEDTHTYTTVDSSVVDTHTTTVPHSDTLPLHSSVVDSILHSTADIDTYIHTAIDTTTLY